jgi:hypothetical protein
LIAGLSHEPREERAVFNKWLPSRCVPVHVFGGGHSGAWLSAEEDNDGIGFGWNEAKEEDVLCAAIIAFKNGIAEGAGRVELDFLVTSTDEVINDV